MPQLLIDFICGCLSGWAQVLTMQPFQIIKVRLANQSLANPTYSGITDCIKQIYKNQGLLAFYKGTLSPLLGTGALVSVDFGTNELIKKMIARVNHQNDDLDQFDSRKLPMSQIILAGLITGFPSALVVAPVDHTRIKMQVLNNHLKYNGSLDVGLKIYKQYGIKGLYQGFNPTLLNEVLSLGVYFGSYEWLLRKYDKRESGQTNKVKSFFAGGAAGCLCWVVTYPLDYVKTIVQSDDTQNRKFKSATQAAIMKYREQGYRTFVKGFGITMIRAFPVNGIGFVTFQYTRQLLDTHHHKH